MTRRSSNLARTGIRWLLAALLAVSPIATGQGYAQSEEPMLNAAEVAITIRQVADWQLENPATYRPLHWGMAALYDGLVSAALATGEPMYLAAVMRTAIREGFRPDEGLGLRSADALAAGHSWLRIYLMDPGRPDLIQPFVQRVEAILEAEGLDDIDDEDAWIDRLEEVDGWSWIDAVYMAPPTMSLLSVATGNYRYLDYAYAMIRATRETLYDPEEHLFYRDAEAREDRSPNGEKVFWGRGNGWAYAGLAAVLSNAPDDYPRRELLAELFLDMTTAVVDTQGPNGLWYPNLLDPEHVPIGETSVSGLFLFGLARGMSLGLLDRNTYWPVLERGWNGLRSTITPWGEVNQAQPVGARPEPFAADTTRPYATGAVLSAGAEIIRLMGGDQVTDQAAFRQLAGSLIFEAPDLSIRTSQGEGSRGY